MNRSDHLLTILIEECAEVAQAASKALRFGAKNVGPKSTLTNAEIIVHEFNDLFGAMEKLAKTLLQING